MHINSLLGRRNQTLVKSIFYVMTGLLREAIVDLQIRMKGNLKDICGNSLSPGGHGGGGGTEQESWCCFADVTNQC